MPGIISQPFKTLTVKELHPTFGAEVSGIDFTQPVPDEQFQEILAAMAKVRGFEFMMCAGPNRKTNVDTLC